MNWETKEYIMLYRLPSGAWVNLNHVALIEPDGTHGPQYCIVTLTSGVEVSVHMPVDELVQSIAEAASK